jgi:hypothetical protein
MVRYGGRGTLYAVQDATIACTYLMLASHATNLRSCWVGAFREEEVRAILNLPTHVRPIAILCIGKGRLPSELTGRMPIAEAATIGDLFVTATGDINVIRKEHMQKMKDGAIIANSGHFNVEINIPVLEAMSRARLLIPMSVATTTRSPKCLSLK